MRKSKVMALKYLNEESKKLLGDRDAAGNVARVADRLTFKDIDGIRKVADLELPGLLELPTSSCDALMLRAARNNGYSI